MISIRYFFFVAKEDGELTPSVRYFGPSYLKPVELFIFLLNHHIPDQHFDSCRLFSSVSMICSFDSGQLSTTGRVATALGRTLRTGLGDNIPEWNVCGIHCDRICVDISCDMVCKVR